MMMMTKRRRKRRKEEGGGGSEVDERRRELSRNLGNTTSYISIKIEQKTLALGSSY